MAEAEDNWWKRCWGILLLTLLPILMNGSVLVVSAEANVGCLFVQTLCLENIEWCFDDFAFGKCLPKYEVDNEEMEREPLTEEQSRIMATMLEEMQGAGLGWDHPFVQCRIQGTLFSMRRNTPLPPNLCANLAPDPEILGPQSPLAFVRFTPPNDDFADEVYYPPIKKGFDDRLYVHPVPPQSNAPPHKQLQPPIAPENVGTMSKFPQPDLMDQQQRERVLEENAQRELLANRIREIQNRIELRRMMAEYGNGRIRPPSYRENEIFPENPIFDRLPMKNIDDWKDAYKRNGPDAIRNSDGIESEDSNEIPSTSFREIANSQHAVIDPGNEFYSHYRHNPLDALVPISRVPKGGHHINDNMKTLDEFNDNFYPLNTYPVKHTNLKDLSPETSGVYTEGGLVYVPDRNDDRYDSKEEARELLANMLGFTRHERLDVKKPGPIVGPPASTNGTSTTAGSIEKNTTETKEIMPAHIKSDSEAKSKKVIREHSDEDHAPYTIDTEYAHVILKTPLDNWRDGARIVSALADMLNMQNYFTHPRVDRHEVSFRVMSNPEKKTAADVARAINDSRFKNNISRRLGVIVVRAGIGDKTKDDTSSVSSSRVEIAEEGPDVTHIMAYMFAGAGAAAVVVIVITLFLIRRHDQKRDKLGGLQAGGLTGGESCSKDYQELCRARMAGKGNTTESVSSGRITSLTKENDRPPSSRSSTSSWSEEPALTNMDISTGHMVLSYMEDHLRNKGRLQREWEALCRYEAEPSAREAAIQTQCAILNRPGAPLPYDHSRVVLNHLANAEGLDYINASTITDHDPRAPAYVAAQGPLPTTLAHFWQMIWEQGAVVIVALCRLQENGDIACARYWPEEGAEVYHIYEVHLVSEHIWCDDYLVRSFYLKNLRTSETRTVTQFHFLSWPQGGAPASAKALLEFRRKVNKSYRGRSCPIVVHGSSGAGRTGAYILLDLVLGRMNKGAREIDIAATLEHLRDQRAGLVATRQQFEFVLMAVAEEVHAILKALPANTQGEKRELDKDAVKEEQSQAIESEKSTTGDESKEKSTEKKDDK